MSIEGAVTSFYRDDYSAAACPAGYQRWAAGGIIFRMILPPPPPPSNKNYCNGTCCKCSNPAEVFFFFAFFLLHRGAANTSGPLPITLPPLSAPSFIFQASAVCCLCTVPKFIKKKRRGKRGVGGGSEGWGLEKRGEGAGGWKGRD